MQKTVWDITSAKSAASGLTKRKSKCHITPQALTLDFRAAMPDLPDILWYDHREPERYPHNGRTLADDVVDLFFSIKKAYTSRAFEIATMDLAKHSQSGGQFFGIHASNDGKIMIFAGGIPLKREGKVVDAIGVSGGSGDQDHAVATAGAAAF